MLGNFTPSSPLLGGMSGGQENSERQRQLCQKTLGMPVIFRHENKCGEMPDGPGIRGIACSWGVCCARVSRLRLAHAHNFCHTARPETPPSSIPSR